MTEKDGSIWMVAKYFKIKEKKTGKKGDAQADSPRDAVRLLKKNKEKSKSNFNRELAALKVLNHPNIVHGVCYNQSRLEIVYPFLRGGDLVPLEDDSLGLKIIKAGGRTSEILNPDQTFLPRFAKQLILAVAHMHKNDLVHFDLKPENFVVAGPNRQFIRQLGSQALEAYDLVLIDFGLAEIESRLTDTCHKAGTEVTMAPEQIICNNPAGFGTDWWGVAAGLYRVRVFWEPSIDETERDRIMHLRDPQWGHVIMPRQPFFSREFGDLLELMLKPNPDDRDFDTRLQELLDHPYIKSATTL